MLSFNLTLLLHVFRLQYMLATYCHVNCITINSTEYVLTLQCAIEGMMMGQNALNNSHSKLLYSRCKSDFFPLHLHSVSTSALRCADRPLIQTESQALAQLYCPWPRSITPC